MFFKMLKNDIKCKKGLNIIIFVFIAIASILVFAGSVQIYSNLSMKKTAEKMCRPSDLILGAVTLYSTKEDGYRNIEPFLDNNDKVLEWHSGHMSRIRSENIDFPGFDEKENTYTYKRQYLTPLPREYDLVYDLNDEPFYVPNGCIALSVTIGDRTGVKVGDIIRLTTVTGKVYELEVCTFFKDNGISSLERYIVSDADYEVLTEDATDTDIVYCVRMKEKKYEAINDLFVDLDNYENLDAGYTALADFTMVSDDDAIMEIISIFVIIISVFLILIIFMTIRFTMVAELKNEEKEIGMMKALGVDSLSFRWLFAAKYIAFAVVGGAIGIAAGLPISGIFVNMFGPDCILPPKWQLILIGVISVLAIIALMIFFSLLVMNRINKISVIDAIHGENRGERFGKSFPVFLHRRKKMSIPFFLALSDVLSRLKRYLFLIIAYTLGTAIILIVFNVRNSCISVEYMKTWLMHTIDFDTAFDSSTADEIWNEAQSEGCRFWEIINKRIENAGIPAHLETMYVGTCEMEHNGRMKSFTALWNPGQPEKFKYHKGGKAPKLANEAAMSSYTAKKLGIHEGDIIKIMILEYNEDKTGSEEAEKEFVITGIFDCMENGDPVLIMGDEYDAGYKSGSNVTGYVIDAPEKDKPAVIKQLRELFGERYILTPEESAEYNMKQYDDLFAALEKVMTIAVVLVLILITYLYVNIFISEEASETALMKSMGFRGCTVQLSYILRMAMLVVSGIILGECFNWTISTRIYNLFMSQWDAAGLYFMFEFPVSFILIPLLIAGTVILTTWLTSSGVRNIDIWKISEE